MRKVQKAEAKAAVSAFPGLEWGFSWWTWHDPFSCGDAWTTVAALERILAHPPYRSWPERCSPEQMVQSRPGFLRRRLQALLLAHF